MKIIGKLLGKRAKGQDEKPVVTGLAKHRRSPLEEFVGRKLGQQKAGVSFAYLADKMDEIEGVTCDGCSQEDDLKKAIPIRFSDIKPVVVEQTTPTTDAADADSDDEVTDAGTPAMDAGETAKTPTAGGAAKPVAPRSTVPQGTGTVNATRPVTARGLRAAPPATVQKRTPQSTLVRSEGADGLKFDPLSHYGVNDKILKHFTSRGFIGFNACSLLAQHELISRACSIPAEDAIAHGYKVVYVDAGLTTDGEKDTKDSDFLVAIKTAADEMGMNQICIDLNYKKKVYGVGIAIPYLEGVDMEKPYNPDSVSEAAAKFGPGIYKGWKVVDPQWVTYHLDERSTTDPCYPDFMVPTYIVNQGKKIHKSWVVRVVNVEVPDILKPSYYFSGIPLTQMLYERVWCADKIANEAPLLAMTKRLLIADGNLEQMIADPKHSNIFMRAINYFRDNWSIFIKKPNANVQQIDTNLAELTPLNAFQYQLFAAIAQIPVTKLMKNVPTGLQSTGDYEKEDYKQALLTIQDHDFSPLLCRHYELFTRVNYWNMKDVDKRKLKLKVKFNPIDMPTNQQVADIESRYANFLVALINGGLVTVDEARGVLRTENNGVFNNLPVSTPEILKKIEESRDPARQQMGGMGGMGGGMMGGGMGGQPGAGGGQPPQQDTTQQNAEAFKQAVAQFQQEKGITDKPVNAEAENGGSVASVEGQGDAQGGEGQGDQDGGGNPNPVQIVDQPNEGGDQGQAAGAPDQGQGNAPAPDQQDQGAATPEGQQDGGQGGDDGKGEYQRAVEQYGDRIRAEIGGGDAQNGDASGQGNQDQGEYQKAVAQYGGQIKQELAAKGNGEERT